MINRDTPMVPLIGVHPEVLRSRGTNRYRLKAGARTFRNLRACRIVRLNRGRNGRKPCLRSWYSAWASCCGSV